MIGTRSIDIHKKNYRALMASQLISLFISLMCMYQLIFAIFASLTNQSDLLQFYRLTDADFKLDIFFLMFPAFCLIIPMMGYLSDKCGKLKLLISCYAILLLAILTGYTGTVLQNCALMLLSLILLCVSLSSIPITLSILSTSEFKARNKLLIGFYSWTFIVEELMLFYRNSAYLYNIKAITLFCVGFIITLITLIYILSNNINFKYIQNNREKHPWKSFSHCLYDSVSSKNIRYLFLMSLTTAFVISFYNLISERHIINNYHLSQDTLLVLKHVFTITKIVSLIILSMLFRKYDLFLLLKVVVSLLLGLILVGFTLNELSLSLMISILSIGLLTMTNGLVWLIVINDAEGHPLGLVIGLLCSIWIFAHMATDFFDTLLHNYPVYDNLLLIAFISLLWSLLYSLQKIFKNKKSNSWIIKQSLS